MNMRAIAQKAGVSSATVSRVINGSPLVKPETAQRVRQVLEAANFIPNPVATTLKYGRSKTFGLIIPDICNPFYSEFLGAFEELLIEIDHEFMATSVQSDEKLLKSVRRMLMRQVDGVVMMASEFDTKAVEPLMLHKIPVVTVDRRSVSRGVSDVAVDFESGFAAAARHLHQIGHRRIGFVGGRKGLETSRVRQAAFIQGLKEVGIDFRQEWVAAGDYRTKGGEDAVLALMSGKNSPTALVAANDLTAFGIIRGLRTLGMSVPHDVSVVGLDDILLAQVIQPSLTTIRIPRYRLARACIEALNFTKDNVEEAGRRYAVPTELVVRESTAAPRRRGR